MTIRLSVNDYIGNDKLRLTKQQLNKKGSLNQKATGVDIKLSKTQLSKQGGFRGALLGAYNC